MVERKERFVTNHMEFNDGTYRFILCDPKTQERVFDYLIQCSRVEWLDTKDYFSHLMDIRNYLSCDDIFIRMLNYFKIKKYLIEEPIVTYELKDSSFVSKQLDEEGNPKDDIYASYQNMLQKIKIFDEFISQVDNEHWTWVAGEKLAERHSIKMATLLRYRHDGPKENKGRDKKWKWGIDSQDRIWRGSSIKENAPVEYLLPLSEYPPELKIDPD